MVDLVAFGIVIDDLVFPDGRTVMGVLGGGGPQAVFGMRLPALAGWTATARVGLVAGIGRDLPGEARSWLASAGIDLTGVHATDLPTPRAWQLMESDGRRTQVWRVAGDVIAAQLERSLDRVPPGYRAALGFHLGIHPDDPNLEFVHQLRALPSSRRDASGLRFPVVSVEPFKPADHPPSDTALRRLCSAADIFSPNRAEAQSLVGHAAPEELARRLADTGARIVALRLGAEGSLIYDGAHLYHVPAIPVAAVDPTGAGNAYCGGFLAGYVQTGDALMAARCGTVAASFLVEQIGLPPINERLRTEANERMKKVE